MAGLTKGTLPSKKDQVKVKQGSVVYNVPFSVKM